ncbi:hypothetical protein [Gordonia sp. (in: high G+C Gram-positive bacteria)]|uniref:hypothetical protein n=1 Tax=Gordonia sp. (in: high G+C Gram-positive bacteria) TaxID=84139 RepID=UPI0039E70C2C
MTNPIELSDEGENALNKLRNARSMLAYWKDVEAEARAVIEAELGDGHDAGTVNGQEVVTWQTVKSNRLDARALKEAQPVVYELYSKPTETRRFVLKDAR